MNMTITQAAEQSAEEIERQSQDAGIPCPGCQGKLTVGEDEAGGCCHSCYFGEAADAP